MPTDTIDWNKYPKEKSGPHGERLERLRMEIPHDTLRTLETAALRAGVDFDAQLEYVFEVVLGGRAPALTDPLTKAQWEVVLHSITFLPDEDPAPSFT